MTQINSFNTIWIAPTYRCNNDCRWCYANSRAHKTSGDLPLDYHQQLADLLSSLKTKKLVLIGGEPTIYGDIIHLIQSLSEAGLSTGMVSNGRRLKDREFTRTLKNAGLKFVTFSVEGYDTLSHDAITRVPGSFEEAINGLENALSLGVNVSTNSVISKTNLGFLERIVDFFTGKVDNMGFNICGVCLQDNSDEQELLNPQEAVKAFERVYDYAKMRGVKTRLVTPMPFCFFDAEHLQEFKQRRIISGGPCQLKTGRNFVVENNGDLIPCTHFVGLPFMNIFEEEGVISKEEFLRRYNDSTGEPYMFRDHFSRYPSVRCDDISCKEPCSGGCPLFWMKFNPEKEIKGITS